MSQFYVVNESTEDTLETTDNLEDAIRFAKEAAKRGQPGDPVSVLAKNGQSLAQFLLLPDGIVQEQPIARPAKPIDATSR